MSDDPRNYFDTLVENGWTVDLTCRLLSRKDNDAPYLKSPKDTYYAVEGDQARSVEHEALESVAPSRLAVEAAAAVVWDNFYVTEGRFETTHDRKARDHCLSVAFDAVSAYLEVAPKPSYAKDVEHPVQPLVFDARTKRVRFKKNPVVAYLLDNGPIDVNHLAHVGATKGFSRGDMEHFAQLIGYSVDGFRELDYVRPKTLATVHAMERDFALPRFEASNDAGAA